MKRVVIADDALLLRRGVSAVLATLDGIEVVAEADPSVVHLVELGAAYLAQIAGGSAETGNPAVGFVAKKGGA
mgnify:CR=1 FL=1